VLARRASSDLWVEKALGIARLKKRLATLGARSGTTRKDLN
jgi:hypothetical protein